MRKAEVRSRFLDSFEELYPRIGLRGMQGFLLQFHDPYGFALRVTLGKARAEVDLLCAALGDGYPETVKRVLGQISESETTRPSGDALPVLIAPYFSEVARDLCRDAGVGYFDLAGNAGLETRRAFLEISEKANANVRQRHVRAPFDGKAERLVRAMLLQPEKRWRMRELARRAGISLGLASMVTSALVDAGSVSKGRSGTDVYDPAALLEAWAERYDLRRSPFRTYRSWANIVALERRLVEHRETLEAQCALTLWSGAYDLLGWSSPTPRLALYWTGDPEMLARGLNLTEDQGKAYVFVFQPYDKSVLWGAKAGKSGLPVAHPVQLYLDLSSGDDEEVLLAQRVRERLLPW